VNNTQNSGNVSYSRLTNSVSRQVHNQMESLNKPKMIPATTKVRMDGGVKNGGETRN
jgi:hypothetical protein